MRRLFACAISALVISGCDRPADIVGPEDPLEGRTASADRIVDLGTLGGTWAVAMDINNRGEVVGFSETASGVVSAFIWTRQGGMTALSDVPGGTRAVAINNQGQVVGDGFGPQGFLWSSDAGVQEITFPPVGAGCPHSGDRTCISHRAHPRDINDHGQVLLTDFLAFYIWSSAGEFRRTQCATEMSAYGINNRGQVVGEMDNTWYAQYETGEYTGMQRNLGFISDPGPGRCNTRLIENGAWLATDAAAINDDGVIAGEGSRIASSIPSQWVLILSDQPSPLRVTTAGGFRFLALGSLGGGRGTGQAVNDRGDIAGYSSTASGASHAFVWTHSGGMKDLGTLGGAASMAMGINAKGDVAGWSLDAAGNRRAVLWTKSGGSISKSSGVTSRPSFNLAPAPAKSFEVANCPGRPGMLLDIGALDRCPVRDGQVR